MAIVTISRGSFSHGKEIAEKAAQCLGYECVSREVLLEASRFFNVSEMKLARSVHDAPGLLDRITHGREKYLNYIRAALLEHVRNDNVVYHGNAGHLLLPRTCSHILRVRIIADMDMRIAFMRESQSISEEKALAFLNNEDRQRILWTKYLYGVEWSDPSLYDMVIKIGKLGIENACDIICSQAKTAAFATTKASDREIRDMAVSETIRALLQDVCEAEIKSVEGCVHVKARIPKIRQSDYTSPTTGTHIEEDMKEELYRKVMEIIQTVPGVKNAACDVVPSDPSQKSRW